MFYDDYVGTDPIFISLDMSVCRHSMWFSLKKKMIGKEKVKCADIKFQRNSQERVTLDTFVDLW